MTGTSVTTKRLLQTALIFGGLLCLNGCGQSKADRENTAVEEAADGGMTGDGGTEGEEENPYAAVDAGEELSGNITEEVMEESGSECDGIQVLAGQDTYEKSVVWYSDTDAFLQDYGYSDAAPFYEYYDSEGNLQMALYYRPESAGGCGIRYDERWIEQDSATEGDDRESGRTAIPVMYGFVWEDSSEPSWEDLVWDGVEIDYTAQTSVWGDRCSDESIENYQEHYEYDEDGRMTHFDAQGVIPGLGEGDEIGTLLGMDYTYYGNGNLKCRIYYHHSLVFSTTSSYRASYFDEQGRLVYEDVYVTHGSLDIYYIYEDDDEAPEYCLILDNYAGEGWYPEFYRYH